MTEREGYQILSKPYITIHEIALALGISPSTANKHIKDRNVERIYKGRYVTTDFIEQFKLNAYWESIKKFGDE